ncbi:glycerol kinase GlpK [Parvularcula sp. LCG005]|uniref:glycerol kinase GlpK n=1 Tax=Parvularcula sp. LCG005 TaxID=3078805 RepID=UPI0029424C9C|nr:glycerol kinase GlpK [Parvularcula sp. LCG005]WOI54533.1 glycerol kinase GlpK [Parvularcula sp. LCG005]
MTEPNLLSIDQGTTSTRVILFSRQGKILDSAQRELPQLYPHDGWVEQDPETIWAHTAEVVQAVLSRQDALPVCLGITNQRETVVIWNRKTGKPIHNAIVWQDRRTAPVCRRMRKDGHEDLVRERTGLLLDPYFSATKIGWLLDHVPGARDAAERGDLAFGTIDSFLLWRLTAGRVHATDATNASRTCLFNIESQKWDDDLLALFGVPAALLPEIKDCADDFGRTDRAAIGHDLPIGGVAGDQHAALIGQACFTPGMVKSTYGTGCFAVLNTGAERARSSHKLLSTLAYRLGGEVTYALEGSIFVAGAAIQWLRDGLGLMTSAAESEAMAKSPPAGRNVYMVPAFTGLGAPHWDAEARGAIYGLTRDTVAADIVRAALESVAFQTHDLLSAMVADAGPIGTVRIDGGMAANDWFCQRLADLCDVKAERPEVTETTALGAAVLAGLSSGIFSSTEEAAAMWSQDQSFCPTLSDEGRARKLEGWHEALRRTLST